MINQFMKNCRLVNKK